MAPVQAVRQPGIGPFELSKVYLGSIDGIKGTFEAVIGLCLGAIEGLKTVGREAPPLKELSSVLTITKDYIGSTLFVANLFTWVHVDAKGKPTFLKGAGSQQTKMLGELCKQTADTLDFVKTAGKWGFYNLGAIEQKLGQITLLKPLASLGVSGLKNVFGLASALFLTVDSLLIIRRVFQTMQEKRCHIDFKALFKGGSLIQTEVAENREKRVLEVKRQWQVSLLSLGKNALKAALVAMTILGMTATPLFVVTAVSMSLVCLSLVAVKYLHSQNPEKTQAAWQKVHQSGIPQAA